MIPYFVRIPHPASTGAVVGVTTTQLGTVISGATRSFLLTEYEFQGQGTSSGANEVGIYRVGTAGVTGTNALVFGTGESPNMTGTTPALAFSGTGFFTYATQPLVGVAVVPSIGINANGQRVFWRADNNFRNAITVPGGNNAGGSIAIYPIAGSGTITGKLGLSEL